MKEITGYLGVPVFLLVSTWGVLKTSLEVLYHLNSVRDFAIGIPENSRGLSKRLRWNLFISDWVPLWFGLFLALLITAAILFMIPPILKSMHKLSTGEEKLWANALMSQSFFGYSHIELACYGMGIVVVFVAIAHLTFGLYDCYYLSANMLDPLPSIKKSL